MLLNIFSQLCFVSSSSFSRQKALFFSCLLFRFSHIRFQLFTSNFKITRRHHLATPLQILLSDKMLLSYVLCSCISKLHTALKTLSTIISVGLKISSVNNTPICSFFSPYFLHSSQTDKEIRWLLLMLSFLFERFTILLFIYGRILVQLVSKITHE